MAKLTKSTKSVIIAAGVLLVLGVVMMILMLTDVLKDGTEIIYRGDEETIRQAFNVPCRDNAAFLPGVMSRKKQVIPMLSVLWG